MSKWRVRFKDVLAARQNIQKPGKKAGFVNKILELLRKLTGNKGAS